MVTPVSIVKNPHFINREHESELLNHIADNEESAIIIVYGRRRVGKTELVEQTFAHRNILKFEGIEGQPSLYQRKEVLRQLAKYTGDLHLSDLQYDSWTPIFELIAKYTADGIWTVYFEELQWLADYKHDLISELKYVWDNYFRRNSKLILILCGSSPSFMINNVLHSKALYNRSMYEIPLQEFSLREYQLLFQNNSTKERMDAYLTVGGIPEYLNRIKKEPSLFLGICNNAFQKGGYFSNECERIFVSSFSNNKNYKMTIDYLAKKRFATRKEIGKHLNLHSGGQLTDLLTDLSICGFIGKYAPFNQKPTTNLIRYCIKDYYLNFYFKFINPIIDDINQGDFIASPTHALDLSSYQKWLGYAFERFCRYNHRLIAKILGFSAVKYRHGVYFSKKTDQTDHGYQLDLVYERKDNVITICEMKYLQNKVGTSVIQELEKKLELFEIPKKFTVQRALITTEGAEKSLISRAYFDRIIVLQDIFDHASKT